jgi:dipeptidyl aminopeptidase/acylaminoacyl peptidase
MAFKDWGFFPHLGRTLARSGFAVATFNFSLNGVRGHGRRITDFERFERNTFGRELDDLASVVDAAAAGWLAPDVARRDAIGLLGHSRGGGIAILQAAHDQRVSALVTLSAIASFDRWTPHQKQRWRTEGHLPLAKNTAVSPLRLGPGLLEEYEKRREEFNLLRAAAAVRVPWLILHGAADVTVPPKEAEALYAAADKHTARLAILDHVGHLYNASSSRDDGYATLDGLLDTTAAWFHQHQT